MKNKIDYYKNTFILFIGKFSNQVVFLILLPLYTYYLSTSSYGYVDLIQTYINLLTPVILLQMDSAVFRFIIDNRKNENGKKNIISSSFYTVFLTLIISILIFIVLNYIFKFTYAYLIIFNLIVLVINHYFMSVVRGNGKNLVYSISSIIVSLLNLIINIFLIMLFKFGAESILISSIISNFISLMYLFIKEKIYLYIKISCFKRKTTKDLLKYSLPMIPNALSWWIVGLSDRTIIVSFINTAANGIYSISCKFSNLLNSIFSVFNMSWQETVSLHIDDDDCDEFLSKMIVEVFTIFVIISCAIIGILPIGYNMLIGKEFLDSYNYIPIILLANLFSVLVGLFGGIYVAKKLTKKVAVTTILSAIINIIFNIAFIKYIGLYAASLSTLISYLAMTVYRYFDVKKIVNIKLNMKKLFGLLIIYFIFGLLYYLKYKILPIIFLIIVVVYFFNKYKKVIISLVKRKFNRS